MGMEMLVRVSIWGSVLGWAAAAGWLMAGRGRNPARICWTAGLVAFAIHVVSAFAAFYGWSHATAHAETARQTAAVTGWNSGAGLWFNYLFGLVWLADAAFWWGGGHGRYFGRRLRIALAVHLFMAFMIFNGAVVFVNGPTRWLGVTVFGMLSAIWIGSRSRRTRRPRSQ